MDWATDKMGWSIEKWTKSQSQLPGPQSWVQVPGVRCELWRGSREEGVVRSEDWCVRCEVWGLWGLRSEVRGIDEWSQALKNRLMHWTMDWGTETWTDTLKKGLKHCNMNWDTEKWTGHTERSEKMQSLRLQDVVFSWSRSGFRGLCRAILHQHYQETLAVGSQLFYCCLFIVKRKRSVLGIK